MIKRIYRILIYREHPLKTLNDAEPTHEPVASRAHSRDSKRSSSDEGDRFLKVTKVDKDLIDMMRLIEITLKRNFEEWRETCDQH